MEKGKACRDLDIENVVVADLMMADKLGPQQVPQQMIDGRIQCDETTESEQTTSLSSSGFSSNSSDSSRKRSISISSGDAISTKKRRQKKKKRVQKKTRKGYTPFHSVDARDTETRMVEPGSEKPDLTVGLTAEDEYEVERIVDRVFFADEFYYQVKWKGWPEEHNSWEPRACLVHSRRCLKEFEVMYREKMLERFRRISEQLPSLKALDGKAALYERDVVVGMTVEDYRSIFKLPKEEEPLPNHMLLRLHINKVLTKGANKNLEAKIKRMVLQREQVRVQFDQQTHLKRFIDSLNSVNGNDLLTIENQVDLAFPPLNFKPIKSNKAHEEIAIPDDPPVGCECDGCDRKSLCCPKLADSEFTVAYNSSGLLEMNYGKPIYECNKTCKCPEDCSNRILQRGSRLKLKIFKTEDKGWGVKAREDIPQGTFVAEYVGEVIARWAVYQRCDNDYKGKQNYIFDLDFNPLADEERFDAEGFEILPYAIDATDIGNVSHFINHSCEPNLGVYVVYVNCLDPQMPHLGMYAIRDIKCGEELFFDYTAEYLSKRRKSSNSKTTKSKGKGNDQFICKCGTKSCRSVEFKPIGFDSK